MSQFYDITGPNGKTYRIEANEGVTQEQALQEFQALGESSWAEYEYNGAPKSPAPKTTAAPKPQAAAPKPAPQAVSTNEPYKPTALEINADMGNTTTRYNKEKRNVPELSATLDQMFASGERNPEAFNKIINAYGPGFVQVTPSAIAQLQKREAWFKARNMAVPEYFNAIEMTGEKDPERPDTLGETVTNAVMRGTGQVYNSGVGLAATGAEIVGAEKTADALLEYSILNNAKMDVNLPRPVDTYKDVGSFGDAALYGADVIGELIPQLAGSAGAGFLGKEAAKRLVAKSVQDMVEAQVANGMTREAAELLAKKAVDKMAKRGATVGITANSIAQETGSTFNNTYAATGEKAPLLSIAAGIASGSLDTILPTKLLTDLGGETLLNNFKKKFIERAVKEGAKDFAIEGATEAVQTFITQLPTSVINGESPFTEEMLDQMIESVFRGGFGGGSVGVVTAGVQQMRTPTYDPVAAQFPTTTTITAPTATVRNSKEFRAQLDAATAQAQTLADKLTSTWTNAPKEVKALPNFVNEKDIDNDAIGVYTEDGRVLINTEAVLKQAERRGVSPDAMVASVTFHESLGHHGLTQMFGDQLDEMLDVVFTQASPELKDQIDRWMVRNPKAYTDGDPNGKYSREAYQEIRATEEVLAEIAEKEGVLPRDTYDKIADLVKNFARRMGMDWKYSSREVRSVLAVAQRNVIKGNMGGATPGTVKNRIVYHGSGADFDKFDHSKMGSGEGQQIFGWGTYLTDVENIAKSYKEKLSDQVASFDGRRGPFWQLRDIAEQKAEEAGIDKNLFELAFTVSTSMGKDRVSAKDIWFELAGPDDDVSVIPSNIKDQLEETAAFFNDNYKVEYSGKTYKVEIPDDAKWIEWEQPLSEQSELRAALEAEGLTVLSREEQAQIRTRIKEVLTELKDPDLTAPQEKALDKEFDELDRLLKNTSFREQDSGEKVYSRLVEAFDSAELASKWLAENGFTGNRYLANNISRKRSRQDEGRDKYNYVVFDDQTPKIVSKYMRDNPTDEVQRQRVKDKLDFRRSQLADWEDSIDTIKSRWNELPNTDLSETVGTQDLEKIIDEIDSLISLYTETMGNPNLDTVVYDEMEEIYQKAWALRGEAIVTYNAGIQDQGANDNPANPFRNFPRVGKKVYSQDDALDNSTVQETIMSPEEVQEQMIYLDLYVFQDKIRGKYMKPSNLDEGDIDYASTDKTTSAGFKRTLMNDRSATEARKQFWKNKTNPDWDPSDPNGLPSSRAKYMRGDTPINPDDLSGEDLVESENAFKLLERASELYQPTRVNIDDIQQDVLDRGVKPSDVTRLVSMNPAKLAQRVFMYDLAAEKLQTRLLNLEEDINTNGVTPEKQAAYINTQATLDELFNDIFDFQAEIGRTLKTISRANFTRRRVAMTAEGLREMLNKENLGALADPETFLKFMRGNAEARAKAIKASTKKNTRGQAIMQYTGIPRALMSSFDLSAPMRQGITFIGNKEYWASFFKMFTMLGKSGRTNYEFLMKQIGRDPNYNLMLRARLSFSELEGKLTNREEDFQTDLAKKIPILGLGVGQSEQAYAGFLNKLRADMFNKLVNQYKDANGEVDDKLLLDIGSFVNSATGRAELKGSIRGTEIYNFASAAPQLNQLFFSSRLIQSRFNMLNPIYYANLDPRIRKQALKEMVKMGTVLTTLSWALTIIPGLFDDEEMKLDLDPDSPTFLTYSQGDTSIAYDPRTTDFLKLRERDTRFDIGGGYSQYLVFGARTGLWMTNSVFGTDIPEQKSTTGKTTKFKLGRYNTNYDDEAYRFFRGKLSPNVSYFVDMAHGENVIGVKFNAAGSLASRMVPMYVASTVELAQQEGLETGIAYSIPAVFGVGVSTFIPKSRDPDQTLPASETYKGIPIEGDVKVWWEATLNNHFKREVFAGVVSSGFKSWDELPNGAKENIIEKAKKNAIKYTKEDADEELQQQ